MARWIAAIVAVAIIAGASGARAGDPPKSPGRALALSGGITAGGVALFFAGAAVGGNARTEKLGGVMIIGGAIAFALGPTTGHVYAQQPFSAGLAIRLIGYGLFAIPFVQGIQDCGDAPCGGQARPASR